MPAVADDRNADIEAVFGEQASDPGSPASPAKLFHLLSHLGAPLTDRVDTFTLVREDLGEVRSLTGEFVICDPLASDARPPAIRQIQRRVVRL